MYVNMLFTLPSKIINKSEFLVFFWNGVPLCIGGQIYPKQHLQSEFLNHMILEGINVFLFYGHLSTNVFSFYLRKNVIDFFFY